MALIKKKIPTRMCIGCHEMKPKRELVRIVKSQDGLISIDLTGKKPGRGAYICFNIDCLEKVQKGKKLERTFEKLIEPEIFNKLREEFQNINSE